MKLLLLLIVISINSFAQASEPVKKSNVILVTYDSVSVGNAFTIAGRTLIDMGYTIGKSDRDFQTIETNIRTFTGSMGVAPVSIVIRVSIKSNQDGKTEAKLSSVFGTALDSHPVTETSYRGMKGSVFMVAFDKMNAVAKELERVNNGKVTYGIQ